jgi:hypothetical protein
MISAAKSSKNLAWRHDFCVLNSLISLIFSARVCLFDRSWLIIQSGGVCHRAALQQLDAARDRSQCFKQRERKMRANRTLS